jgi:hypothetical protein
VCVSSTRHVQDGKLMKARCTTHAACIAAGLMVQPSGRCVALRCKTGNIKDLNWNLKKHLRKWDDVLGTTDETVCGMRGKYMGQMRRF